MCKAWPLGGGGVGVGLVWGPQNFLKQIVEIESGGFWQLADYPTLVQINFKALY